MAQALVVRGAIVGVVVVALRRLVLRDVVVQSRAKMRHCSECLRLFLLPGFCLYFETENQQEKGLIR